MRPVGDIGKCLFDLGAPTVIYSVETRMVAAIAGPPKREPLFSLHHPILHMVQGCCENAGPGGAVCTACLSRYIYNFKFHQSCKTAVQNSQPEPVVIVFSLKVHL